LKKKSTIKLKEFETLYTIGKRGAKPSIGDMLNVLYQLRKLRLQLMINFKINMTPIQSRENLSDQILEGRFIRRVLQDAAKDIDKARKYISRVVLKMRIGIREDSW
jgi:hypothetical protein